MQEKEKANAQDEILNESTDPSSVLSEMNDLQVNEEPAEPAELIAELPVVNDLQENEEPVETAEPIAELPVVDELQESEDLAETAEPIAELPVVDDLQESEEPVETAEPIAESTVSENPVEESSTKVENTEHALVDKDQSESEQADETDHEDQVSDALNFAEKSKLELVEFLEDLVNSTPVQEIKVDVDKIKSYFYKRYRAEVELLRKAYLDEGGDPATFAYEPDPLEDRLKQSLSLFKRLKTEFIEAQEKDKLINLARKYEIIEKIKELINGQESMNRTFNEFKSLQNEWHEIGSVPQTEIKNLWENYHHNVEQFYDFIKINKELRDLDQKKNLDAKVNICERAEELLLEPSVVKAFSTLQTLHEEWREIGPVSPEKREDVWTRFKMVTASINKNHQDYFQTLKEEQHANLQAKMALVEKAEEIAALNLTDAKEWEEKTNELTEVQKIWKTIGFATKKDNNKIFEQFRTACDLFFTKKRDYYKEYKDSQTENLQQKTDLCLQAEAIKDSQDWKSTTDELIQLQKRWKEIGPVPKKLSDLIWKRFRAACNEFFEKKNKHFENIDSVHDENLRLKKELIEKVKTFIPGDNVEDTIHALKVFQSDWTEIGHVPIKVKDKIQGEFRELINEKFASIKVDEGKRNVMMFKQRLEHMKQSGAPAKKNKQVYGERDKILDRIRQLESDIVVLDNNIGFFAKTKNAETLINDVKKKIEKAKQQIIVEKQKLDVLNKFE
jgi:hypothetical protein